MSAFVWVVAAVGAVGVLGAAIALFGGRGTWEGYGADHLVRESDEPGRGRAAGRGPAAREADEEVRQLIEARNLRRRRRGEPELDPAAELARVRGDPERPAVEVDAALREEIRALVLTRNRRRARRGEPALDVEAEIAREIARLPR